MTATTTEPTQATAAPAQNRLSVSQMLRVMRVEYHRAQSQRYPIVCLMIAVDGLEVLFDRYGHEFKSRLVRTSYDLLRQITKEHGFFGMGLMSGDRVMAVFPNTEPARGAELGRLLCEGANRISAEFEGTPIPIEVMVGGSHSLTEDTSSFEGFVEMAGRALSIATEAEGTRCVIWRETEAEIGRLKDEIQERSRAFQEQHDELVEEVSAVGGLDQSAVLDRFQAAFAGATRTEELEQLEQEVLALVQKELFEERHKAIQAQVAEHKKQIDMLERRIVKLTGVLGVTEEELKRVLSMKSIDSGVASIYRTVQGLCGDDEDAEVKKEMMSVIFQANLEIQKPGAA